MQPSICTILSAAGTFSEGFYFTNLTVKQHPMMRLKTQHLTCRSLAAKYTTYNMPFGMHEPLHMCCSRSLQLCTLFAPLR
jgi:hypothetical protein